MPAQRGLGFPKRMPPSVRAICMSQKTHTHRRVPLGISLLLPAIATMALWLARSRTAPDVLVCPAPLTRTARLVPGAFRAQWTGATVPTASLPVGTVPLGFRPPLVTGTFGGHLIFFSSSRWWYITQTTSTLSRSFYIQFKPVFVATLLLAALGVWVLRLPPLSERRRRLGLCGACGYDLQGGQLRCPECGDVAVARTDTIGWTQ
jgi:hypothetical protein